MKTEKIIMVSAAILLTVMTSCQNEEYGPRSGNSIVFSTWTPGSASTSKAVYTGAQQTVGDKKYEGINWEAGDVISIASPQTAKKCDEYRIVTGGGNESAAEPVNQGLTWGSGKHTFYGMYPGLSAVSGSGLTDAGRLTGVIPSTQKPKYDATGSKYVITAGDGSYTVPADLKNGYMYSKATGVEAFSENVALPFIPFTTAIRFTITNDYPEYTDKTKEVLNIRSISVISENYKLAGTFTADLTSLDASGYPSCTTATGEKDRVTMDFTGTTEAGYISLSRGKTLEFTLFLLPSAGHSATEGNVIDDLTFRINKGTDSVDEGWIQTKLAYKDMTGIAFPCYKKSYVTGILVPEGAIWTVKFAPGVDAWGDGGTPSEDIIPETGHKRPVVCPWTFGKEESQDLLKYNYLLDVEGPLEFGHEGTAGSTITINSQREFNHSRFSVVWYLEYWDGSEWKMAKSNQKINNLVTLNPVIGTGDGEDIEVFGPAEINVKVEPIPSGDIKCLSHNARLQGATAKGTSAAPYDLSMHDIYGNARKAGKPVCANSYVINAPGCYAIPLIYGNAIDSDAAPASGVNTPSFNPGGESESVPAFLSMFPNSNGRRILTPGIESDPSSAAGSWTAEVLWKAPAGIGVDCSIVSKAAAPGMGLKSCDCGYLVFNVSSTGLTQGNFVVAVKNGGQVMWSWHVWVTDNDLTAVPVSSTSPKSMLPYNLGWVDSDVTTPFNSYARTYVKLRAVQRSSGMTLEFNIGRRSEDEAPHTSGSSLYWQWGRKDPFTGSPSTKALSTSDNLAYSIKNPATFIYSAGGKYQWYYEQRSVSETDPTKQEAAYRNLWSTMNKNTGTGSAGYNTKPYKTVYDPCPPGFQIPQADAFGTIGAGALQPAGYISYTNGTYVSDGGYYWNAVPSDAEKSYYTGATAGYNQSAYRANGYSVWPVAQ